MNRRTIIITGLLIIALFAAGCNFTTTTTNTFNRVKVGMTPEQVIGEMGEAQSVTAIEFWRYQEDDTAIEISIQDGKVTNVRTVTVKSMTPKEK